MPLDRDGQKKLLKRKDAKSLDDFDAVMREVSKEVVETLADGELDHGQNHGVGPGISGPPAGIRHQLRKLELPPLNVPPVN